MKPNIWRLFGVFGLLAVGTISLALAGCATEVSTEGEQVTTKTDDLTLGNSTYDGRDGPPRQCTVNGVTMHCCPPKTLMTGANVDANIFRCSSLVAGVVGSNTFMDGPDSPSHVVTQRQNMHACPFPSVMVGFHRDRNDLLCVSLGLENPIFETVDNGTQDPVLPGHVCPPSNGSGSFNGGAMSGIRVDQNRFLCAN